MAKYSVTLKGHNTSISLEPEFLAALKEIAAYQGKSVRQIVIEIDDRRAGHNLTSALRLFILDFYKSRPAAEG